jgi:hypothetical protein
MVGWKKSKNQSRTCAVSRHHVCTSGEEKLDNFVIAALRSIIKRSDSCTLYDISPTIRVMLLKFMNAVNVDAAVEE